MRLLVALLGAVALLASCGARTAIPTLLDGETNEADAGELDAGPFEPVCLNNPVNLAQCCDASGTSCTPGCAYYQGEPNGGCCGGQVDEGQDFPNQPPGAILLQVECKGSVCACVFGGTYLGTCTRIAEICAFAFQCCASLPLP